MMESPSGFSKLISGLPKTFSVLDVGSGGLQGKNTTEFLAAHFGVKNILGVCKSDHEVKVYNARRAEDKLEPIKIISADFYHLEFDPPTQFDLVVLDTNIESNLEKDWSHNGLQRMYDLVKDGGYLINYIMLTDQYGDAEKTPAFIRKYWKEFWNTEKLTVKDIGRRLKKISGWDIFAYEREKRREYILWIMLKKTSGL